MSLPSIKSSSDISIQTSLPLSLNKLITYFGINYRLLIAKSIQNKNNFETNVTDYNQETQLLKLTIQSNHLSTHSVQNEKITTLIDKYLFSLDKKKTEIISDKISNQNLINPSITKNQIQQRIQFLALSADPYQWNCTQTQLNWISQLFNFLDKPNKESPPPKFFYPLYKKAALISPPIDSSPQSILITQSQQLITWGDLIQMWGKEVPSKKETANDFLQKHPYFSITKKFPSKNFVPLKKPHTNCTIFDNLSFKNYLKLKTYQSMIIYLMLGPSYPKKASHLKQSSPKFSEKTIKTLLTISLDYMFIETNRLTTLFLLARGFHLFPQNQLKPPPLFEFFYCLYQFFYSPLNQSQNKLNKNSFHWSKKKDTIAQWLLNYPLKLAKMKTNPSQIPCNFIYQITRDLIQSYGGKFPPTIPPKLFQYLIKMIDSHGKEKLCSALNALHLFGTKKGIGFEFATIQNFMTQFIQTKDKHFCARLTQNNAIIQNTLLPQITSKTPPLEEVANFLLSYDNFINSSDIVSFITLLKKHTDSKEDNSIYILDLLSAFKTFLIKKNEPNGFEILDEFKKIFKQLPLAFQDLLTFINEWNSSNFSLDHEKLDLFKALSLSPFSKLSPLNQLKHFKSLISSIFLQNQEINSYIKTNFKYQSDFIPKSWKFQKILGRGSFGVVVLVNTPKQKIVLKIIPKFFAQKEPTYNLKSDFIGSEALLLNLSKTPNYPTSLMQLEAIITKARASENIEIHEKLFLNKNKQTLFSTKKEDNHKNIDFPIPSYIIATQSNYISSVSLQKILDFTHQLHLNTIKKIALLIVKALHFLHSNQVIHCDLKPDNILIRKDWGVCLCDFGSLRIENSTSQENLSGTQTFGTPQYMAPEIHNKKDPTTAADIFSIGVLLYQLFFGSTPYSDRFTDFKEKYQSQNAKPIPFTEKITLDLQAIPHQPFADLIFKCLNVNPKKRLTASQILTHSFFKL